MKQKKILHILSPDKFTIPFIRMINKEFNYDELIFLCCSKPDDDFLLANRNVKYLANPYRKNFIRNSIVFYSNMFKASKIIIHGTPVLFYLFFLPWMLRKTYWIIMGYEIPDKNVGDEEIKPSPVQNFIKRFVLKRIPGHITHIEGDSEYLKAFYKSTAKFYYSPIYLSNVVSKYNSEKIISGAKNDKIKILVGNSTSPTNNHASIFNMLLPYKNDNIVIYCPLSYGIYNEYKDYVIQLGKDLFSEKFVPLTEFMNMESYLSFLQSIDVAVFNHQRQEAMGVTLQLLNFGKVVYMNKNTTSFKSFINRGFKVFDNELIAQTGINANRDVLNNPELVSVYYSYEKLIKSWSDIFNN